MLADHAALATCTDIETLVEVAPKFEHVIVLTTA
jgi:hypothetical protein